MRKDIIALLGLQNVWVDTWEIKEYEIIVKIRSPRIYALCPYCTRSVKHIHQHHQRKVRHSVWQDRDVTLLITRRRFYCTHCNRAFMEYLPGIDKRRSTQNFRDILIKEVSGRSFHSVIRGSHTSHSVLSRVVQEQYNKKKNIDWTHEGTNLTIGVDEHSYRGRHMVLTITNISKRRLLHIAQDDRIATLTRFLETIEKQRVKEVCIDMKAGYLFAIQDALPRVIVTVDKFHVVAHANKVVDQLRSIIVGKQYHMRRLLFRRRETLSCAERKKLDVLFKKFSSFPSLYQVYDIKERIRTMYHAETKKHAQEQMKRIILLCECSDSQYIRDLGRTLKRWQPYILNYFNRFSTNAFTEGVHTKIKMMKRVSFGFRNVTSYVAKMSLAFMPLLYYAHHTF